MLISVDLVDRVGATARHENSTITAHVLRIITNELDHLADLVIAERPPATTTGPFPDSAERRPTEPKSQLFLRLTPANAEALDDLVTTAGATSRSQFITAALRQTPLAGPHAS